MVRTGQAWLIRTLRAHRTRIHDGIRRRRKWFEFHVSPPFAPDILIMYGYFINQHKRVEYCIPGIALGWISLVFPCRWRRKRTFSTHTQPNNPFQPDKLAYFSFKSTIIYGKSIYPPKIRTITTNWLGSKKLHLGVTSFTSEMAHSHIQLFARNVKFYILM